tara:strand:+ start:66 stop:386 length:321 start_codon:yes stop_codon:yes gene_type:complete
MIAGIQIIGILFALIMLYVTFLHQKRKELSSLEFSFWLILWFIFIYVTAFPSSLDFIVKSLNVTRAFDLLIVLGFLFLISLGLYNYFLEKNNRKKIEKIVRKIALK